MYRLDSLLDHCTTWEPFCFDRSMREGEREGGKREEGRDGGRMAYRWRYEENVKVSR